MATITIQFANGRTKTLSQRELRSRFWGLALALAVVVAVLMFPFRRIIDEQNAGALRPTMERIADHGGGVAGMWLVSHFGERWRLPAAAAAGDPQAQYLQGRLLIYHGHRRAGLRLIRRSAAARYPCAVMREDLHRKNSVFSSCE